MKFSKFSIYFWIILAIPLQGTCSLDDYIVVNKKNVVHKFVHFDPPTDHFTMNVFAHWENETFDIFDLVKDSQSIAIDLGAWIGTTSIWLSKNFYHVIAVDADVVSLQCLKMNLEASKCPNVDICSRPVSDTCDIVTFGSQDGGKLNQSTSTIKNNQSEYQVQAITFKQLIYDYIFTNELLKDRKIAFIKCDIEGGEEKILEDILYFAYHNNCKAFISFHINWWKSKKITDFEYLFKHFKTNHPEQSASSYIQQNPFGSLLFQPVYTSEPFVKKNMPAVIIGYNQATYIKNMVTQLEKYTSDIILIDNNSTFKPLLDYYSNDYKYTLLRQKNNYGHTVYRDRYIQYLLGNYYILTDPDLAFNSELPDDFIKTLFNISSYFNSEKTGFALCIDSPQIRDDIQFHGYSIKKWESQFWRHKISYPADPALELYDAEIDTTFCLINRKSTNPRNIRVAGNFTCLHLPWYKDFKIKLLPGEYEAYQKNNISSCWFK